MDQTRDYYRRRAAREIASAEIAQTPQAREIHMQLAEECARRAEEAMEETPNVVPFRPRMSVR